MTCYLTPEELCAIQNTELSRDTPFLIQAVTGSYFSVARMFGRATVQGWGYKYFPETDELVRHDVVKWAERRRRFSAKLQQAEAVQETADLFGGAK